MKSINCVHTYAYLPIANIATIANDANTQGGNENDSFILSDPIEGILVINKALDYDHGSREFKIQIQASVSSS